jgi:hypothetical protein
MIFEVSLLGTIAHFQAQFANQQSLIRGFQMRTLG